MLSTLPYTKAYGYQMRISCASPSGETVWRSGCPKSSSNRISLKAGDELVVVAATKKRQILAKKRDRRAEFLKAMDQFR